MPYYDKYVHKLENILGVRISRQIGRRVIKLFRGVQVFKVLNQMLIIGIKYILLKIIQSLKSR